MKIIVTGGLGYIGSNVCLELLLKGHEICILDNLCNSSLIVLDNLKFLSQKNIEFFNCDVRNINDLYNVIDQFKPEGAYHFAGLKSVTDSLSNPLEYYDVNVTGTVNLLKALTRVNAKAVVFSSSATLYGQSASGVCFETDPTIPINPYGWTKLMSEQVLRDWVEADRSRRAICLRYFNPIGAHESGLLGEPVNGKQANLLPALIDVWLKRTGELAVFGGDYNTFDGTAERDYVHIYDIANGHVQVLEHICQMSSFETLNLGTGKSTTVLNLIREFERACGDEIPVNICDRRDGDSQSCYANVEKARQLIGFECRKTLYEACVDACNYATKNFDPQHDR